eukprot:GHVS01081180.1.p1 GENE.GHVS01081180.1~~GHVS01081180.1.p1  ORF type:complete len:323 (+),score=53.40 GHVS01081180.1:75-971(+)
MCQFTPPPHVVLLLLSSLFFESVDVFILTPNNKSLSQTNSLQQQTSPYYYYYHLPPCRRRCSFCSRLYPPTPLRPPRDFGVDSFVVRAASKNRRRKAGVQETDEEEVKVDGVSAVGEALKDAKLKLSSHQTYLTETFAKYQSGKVTAILIDNLSLDYFGVQTTLRKLANITARDARRLIIEPFDSSIISKIALEIEQHDDACRTSDDGKRLTVTFPEMTTERRKSIAKRIKAASEDCKTAMRNVRRDLIEKIKKFEKSGCLGEDHSRKFQNNTQKLLDGFIKQIDESTKRKEKEMLCV